MPVLQFVFARSAYLNNPTVANAGWSVAKLGSIGAFRVHAQLPSKSSHFEFGFVWSIFVGRLTSLQPLQVVIAFVISPEASRQSFRKMPMASFGAF
jgi:hypothetical protein